MTPQHSNVPDIPNMHLMFQRQEIQYQNQNEHDQTNIRTMKNVNSNKTVDKIKILTKVSSLMMMAALDARLTGLRIAYKVGKAQLWVWL